MAIAVVLRPVAPGDEDFLAALYADSRAEEFAGIGWPVDQVAQLLRMQFEAQRTDYVRRFPHADHDIVLDGLHPVGRIWVDRGPEEIRLLDLSIHSSARNRGIGTHLLRRLQEESVAAGVPLRHSVVKENVNAMRLYRRLGFVIVAGSVESHHLMVYRPPDQ